MIDSMTHIFDSLVKLVDIAGGYVPASLLAAARELAQALLAAGGLAGLTPSAASLRMRLEDLMAILPQAKAVGALALQLLHMDASDPAVLAAARLKVARATATRDCANLRCPHFSGAGRRGKKCAGCRAVRYCCQECNVAGWRAGHKHVCAALAAERQSKP